MKRSMIKNGFQRSAFTLVELLVVISIIALLVSILMPALSRAREQAKAVICMTNLKQWTTILSMYTMDNKGSFSHGIGKEGLWIDALRDYYDNVHEIRDCSKIKASATDLGLQWFESHPSISGSIYVGWGRENALEDPSNPDFYYYGSYALNWWLYDEPTVAPPGKTKWYPGLTSPEKYFRNLDMRQAYNVPLFMDSTWRDALHDENTSPPPDVVGYPPGGGYVINRHGRFTEMGFADLSVRKVELREIWDFKWHKTYKASNSPYSSSGGVLDNPHFWPDWIRDLYGI